MIKLIGIFLIMSLIIPSVIYAEIYKWVNDDGSIGFTDDLSRKSNQSITKEESVKEEYQKQEELSPEEKDELDKKLRGIWDDMKKSLKGR